MKDKILKGTTAIAVISLMVGVSMLDSESIIPLVICLISIAWITFITCVNRGRRDL